MTTVERYQAPIRRAFNTICRAAPDTGQDKALQMAVKAINNSAVPDRLDSTLPVLGALPRLDLPTDSPSLSTLKREAALRNAI